MGEHLKRITNLTTKFTTMKYKKNKEKNGFVDMNLIYKPTAIVKLKNMRRNDHKIKNFLSRLHVCKVQPKKIDKRQNQNRVQRFNIFKEIKNIFMDRNNKENAQPDKTFIDDINFEMNTPKLFRSQFKTDKITEIKDMLQQIPNITSDIKLPYTYIGNIGNIVYDKLHNSNGEFHILIVYSSTLFLCTFLWIRSSKPCK